jgi:hypothetical protein
LCQRARASENGVDVELMSAKLTDEKCRNGKKCSMRSTDRPTPPDTFVGKFNALPTVQVEAETDAVVFAFEASKRNPVVDLPTVNPPAVDRQPLNAHAVFGEKFLMLDRRVRMNDVVVRRSCAYNAAEAEQE